MAARSVPVGAALSAVRMAKLAREMYMGEAIRIKYRNASTIGTMRHVAKACFFPQRRAFLHKRRTFPRENTEETLGAGARGGAVLFSGMDHSFVSLEGIVERVELQKLAVFKNNGVIAVLLDD